MITIPIVDHTAIVFILTLIVLFSIWVEKNSKVFKKLGAAALTILIAMVISNVGIIPGESPVYDFFRGNGVLAGIILVLLGVNLRSIKKASGPMLKAFFIGAFGSAFGAVVMGMLLLGNIGADTWKLSGQFAATYIGGGVNFAAIGHALNTSSEFFTAGIAADVIVTAIWLIVCLVVPEFVNKGENIYNTDGPINQEQPTKSSDAYTLEKLLYSSGRPISLVDIALLLTIVVGAIWFSNLLASLITVIPMIIWLTTFVLLIAQIPAIKNISGGMVIGNYLLMLFLACNGARSVISKIIELGPSIFYFALGTVIIHGLIIFGIGSMMKLDWKTMAVASQANIGGATSAMALASARRAPNLILSGVAVALIGTALGNYIGLLIANIVETLLVLMF